MSWTQHILKTDAKARICVESISLAEIDWRHRELANRGCVSLRIGCRNSEGARKPTGSEFNTGIGERDVALENIVEPAKALSVSPGFLFRRLFYAPAL